MKNSFSSVSFHSQVSVFILKCQSSFSSFSFHSRVSVPATNVTGMRSAAGQTSSKVSTLLNWLNKFTYIRHLFTIFDQTKECQLQLHVLVWLTKILKTQVHRHFYNQMSNELTFANFGQPNNANFHHMSLYDVADLDRTYDFVNCVGVLHHLPDPNRYIYIYIYKCICIYIYVYIHICKYTHMCEYIYTCDLVNCIGVLRHLPNPKRYIYMEMCVFLCMDIC